MDGSDHSRSGVVAPDSSDPETDQALLRLLAPVALGAVQSAAVAAALWSGRGDGEAADGAAASAMRAVLARGGPAGTVVTGEGEKDDAPMLASDEQLGGDGPAYDIAVDPLECTSPCAAGLPGALTTIAMAARGAMHFPGPAFYMDKLVVGPAARDVLNLERGSLDNARRIAEALGVPISPQLKDEAAALAAAGVDVDAILELDDMVSGPALFAAAGVTGGDLLAPQPHPDGLLVHTLLVTSGEARRAAITVPLPGQ